MRKVIWLLTGIAHGVAWVSSAQMSLLDFKHSRVVESHYNSEISNVNQIIYFDGTEIVSDKIDCLCERKPDGQLVMRFSKSFNEDGQRANRSSLSRFN